MSIVSKDGSGDFSTLQEAVDAVPDSAGEEERRILVRPGEYREKVVVHKDRLRITGEDPERTVLAWNGCAKDQYPDGTEKGTFLSATLVVTGRDVTVENLAVAVYAAGDRGTWRNCRFLACQDTLFCGPVRLPNTRADQGTRHPAQRRLTDAETEGITVAAVLGGTDGWRPDQAR